MFSAFSSDTSLQPCFQPDRLLINRQLTFDQVSVPAEVTYLNG